MKMKNEHIPVFVLGFVIGLFMGLFFALASIV
jgi:hypothetical protein